MTRLLSGSAPGCCLLPQESEGQKEVLEAEDNEEKESEIRWRGRREREPLNVRMRHGYDDETNKAQT